MASAAGRSTGATVAIAAIVIGAIVSVIGVAGAAADWGSSSKSSASIKPLAISATAPTASSTSPRPESAVDFVTHLDAAIKNHDVEFLFTRLHPAVIARYGAARCRAFVGNVSGDYIVTGTPSAPSSYAYASDRKTTEVANVVSVPVRIPHADGTVENTALHTARVDGTYRYFVDCGTPAT